MANKLSVDVKKCKAGSVGGMQRHDQREPGETHSNKDIDDSRTHLNYDLHNENEISFTDKINDRIKEEGIEDKKAIRSDANVMLSVVVQVNKDFFKEIGPSEQERFFQESYKMLAEKYGKENTISAIVHLDEKSPHMHFKFVPITEDHKLKGGMLTNKPHLSQLHTEIADHLKKCGFDIERGQKSEIPKERFTLVHWKAQELEKLEQTLSLKGEDLTSLQADLEARGAELEKSKASITAEIAENNKFLEQIQSLKVTREQINDIDRRSKLKEKTLGLFGERKVETTFEDFCTLVHTAQVSAEAVSLVEPLKEKNAELTEINSKNKDLSKTIDVLNKEKSHFTKENAELKKAVDGIAKELYLTHRSAGLNDKSCAALMLKSTEISRNVVINTIAKNSPNADKMSDKANAYAKDIVKSAETILDGGKTKSKGGGMAGRGGRGGGGRSVERDIEPSRPLGGGMTVGHELSDDERIQQLMDKGMSEEMAIQIVSQPDD